VRSRRYRHLRLACAFGTTALLAALALAASGCGGIGVSGASNLSNLLTVYSSLPLQGPSAAVSGQIVNGEKLALYEVGGQVGPFRVSYSSLDDANPQTKQWDPGITAAAAKTAAQDTSTIAYLGDYNSPATAISLPLMNAPTLASPHRSTPARTSPNASTPPAIAALAACCPPTPCRPPRRYGS
jgi:branched-chain amino acid transport system substrate-binding protein